MMDKFIVPVNLAADRKFVKKVWDGILMLDGW
jgi:hypothetical protein